MLTMVTRGDSIFSRLRTIISSGRKLRPASSSSVDGLVRGHLGGGVEIVAPAAVADGDRLDRHRGRHPGQRAQGLEVFAVQLPLVRLGVEQGGDENRRIGLVQARGAGHVGGPLADDERRVGHDGQRQGDLQGDQQRAELVAEQGAEDGSKVVHAGVLIGF
ncbi:MAG: hypothetical protein MUE63_11755 [Xanthomonadales bacterium]|nr:hypothetical protein [Xanthomonadales bacterium]